MPSGRGAGKVRHIGTAQWIQQHVSKKTTEIWKIKGTENGADLSTKHLDGQGICRRLELLSLKVQLDAADGALSLQG